MKKRIVIIGGCAAGPKTAAKSRRMDEDTEINLYTMRNYVSYSACGLPYYIGGLVKDVNKLIIRTPEQFKEKNLEIEELKSQIEKYLLEIKDFVLYLSETAVVFHEFTNLSSPKK